MGGHRARRWIGGLAVTCAAVTAGWLYAEPAAPDIARTSVVTGSVAADGTASALGDGWSVRHPARGRYELRAPGPIELDVESWDVPAVVTTTPEGERDVTVEFSDAGGAPVEVRFLWRALLRSR